MSALEIWLMELLLEQDIAMLRAEADIKAKVLALLVAMQKNLVSLIANSPDVSELTKAARSQLLKEATAIIESGYGAAQGALDLRMVGEVESLAVRKALETVLDARLDAAIPVKGAARESVIAELRRAAERQAASAPIKAEAARQAAIEKALKGGATEDAAATAGRNAAARSLEISQNGAIRITEATKSTMLEIRMGAGLPTETYLKKVASEALIQGAPSREWWARQSADTAFKLSNEIRAGAALGETNQQIIKRIVGEQVTAKAPADDVGPPGIMPLARKNAASIVQSSMATIAAEARRKTMELNRDLTNGIMQVSTLDGHTSLTCVAYDGAEWDHDYEPMGGNDLPYNGGVPRHWNCRSSEIPVMKTFREMGIDLDEPEDGTRASSSGQVSAKTKFADYLTMKGEAYQNEVLGPGRAELFRAGKLTPRDLVDMSGRPVRLETLRAQYQ